MKRKIIPIIKGITSLMAVIVVSGLMVVFCGTIANAGAPKVAMFIQDTEPILDWGPSVESGSGKLVLNSVYETLHEKF